MPETHHLADILILLAAAVVAIPVSQRLGLGSVPGYLVAGAVVGPWGLGFINQIEEIRNIAELGVLFLLFIVGIELKPRRLWSLRRGLIGIGGSQVLMTGLAICGLAMLFGQSLTTAVIIGFGLALSSTAFGLHVLSERRDLGSRHGRTALSVLLFQDLAVVPLLALVSLIAADTPLLQGIEFAILEAVLVMAAVILFGRFLLSPALRLVARSRTAEVFTAAAIFAVLGTAWVMEQAGLSLALGAFLAGLMLADSQYRHQVIADIKPFRGILLGLFFMGVGMSIDFGLMGEQGGIIIGLVLLLLTVKAGILWGICRLMGVETRDATSVSLLLAQSGEFGFIIFGVAASTGLLSQDLFTFLLLLVALSMVATPLMVNFGDYLNRRRQDATDQHDVSTEHIDEQQAHVVIAGFGRVGARMARILESAKVPYVAIDIDADRVAAGRREGLSVFFGDARQVDVLKAADADNAAVVACTLDEAAPAVRLVRILRQQYPSVAIYARGRDRRHCDDLLQAGATAAFSEMLEASLQMGEVVLSHMGVAEKDANALIESLRRDYYG
ncbi:MAG: monovalent cation:proton antiporter-2 (CPA2) family protein [Gammaproteobacteria bacterium]